MQRVAPVASVQAPSWRRAAVIFFGSLAVIAIAVHGVVRHVGFGPDVMLQTGEQKVYEHSLETVLAQARSKAMGLARKEELVKMDPGFWNDMHAMTNAYFESQGNGGDCGVPGGATDKRRAGCVIPVSGPTVDLACCTSCCHGIMGECGPCEGLGEGVEHTDKRKVVEIQPAAPAESVDCGTPGTPSDIRRQGCTIPVDGSTADLTCCESCCQGLMGECGDCSGLGTEVPHTV